MRPVGLSLLLHVLEHSAPAGHPENSSRLHRIMDHLQEKLQIVAVPVISAVEEFVMRIHSRELIADLRKIAAEGGGFTDPDTFVTSQSVAAAFEVTGAMLGAVDSIFGKGPAVSLVIGRPPGHHAERTRAMGFCLINHVAIAADYAISRRYADKVAIIDFDVHHGNGTQWIFYDRSDVLYISTHQHPFYPGSGGREEQGNGPGRGFTINYPLSAGTSDSLIAALYENDIAPKVMQFAPDLVLVSAGFDGHHLDPMGWFELTGDGYRQIGAAIRQVVEQTCNGRTGVFFEGGYSSEGNYEGLLGFLQGLGVAA